MRDVMLGGRNHLHVSVKVRDRWWMTWGIIEEDENFETQILLLTVFFQLGRKMEAKIFTKHFA